MVQRGTRLGVRSQPFRKVTVEDPSEAPKPTRHHQTAESTAGPSRIGPDLGTPLVPSKLLNPAVQAGGMVTIAVISDSHIPERADGIPAAFRERIATADRVVHAGDFTDPTALETVRELAGDRLTAVYGNMDPRNLDLPAVVTFDAGGVTFVVTHGTGDLETYESRVAEVVKEEADDAAVGIAGHTHEVLDDVVDGVRLLNPGSVTGAPPAERTTMFELEAEDGEIDVSLHEV